MPALGIAAWGVLILIGAVLLAGLWLDRRGTD